MDAAPRTSSARAHFWPAVLCGSPSASSPTAPRSLCSQYSREMGAQPEVMHLYMCTDISAFSNFTGHCNRVQVFLSWEDLALPFTAEYGRLHEALEGGDLPEGAAVDPAAGSPSAELRARARGRSECAR